MVRPAPEPLPAWAPGQHPLLDAGRKPWQPAQAERSAADHGAAWRPRDLTPGRRCSRAGCSRVAADHATTRIASGRRAGIAPRARDRRSRRGRYPHARCGPGADRDCRAHADEEDRLAREAYQHTQAARSQIVHLLCGTPFDTQDLQAIRKSLMSASASASCWINRSNGWPTRTPSAATVLERGDWRGLA